MCIFQTYSTILEGPDLESAKGPDFYLFLSYKNKLHLIFFFILFLSTVDSWLVVPNALCFNSLRKHLLKR